MTLPTIMTGLILVGLGEYSYLNGTPNEMTGKVSPTALIPAAFGAVLVLCGLAVAAKESLRKHVMHVAAMVGLLGVVGGFMPVVRAGGVDLEKPSIQAGLGMSAVCLVFVGLCVKSFIDARKARQAAAGSASGTL